MGGILLLLALCVVMALASFLAGALPLSMTLSQSQLRLISSIGVGILVGTSLIVIIPEGIEAAASPGEGGHVHKIRSLVRRSPWSHGIVTRGLDSLPTIKTTTRRDDLDPDLTNLMLNRIVVPLSSKNYLEARAEDDKPAAEAPAHDDEKHDNGQNEHEHENGGIPTFEIGFSLITGFLLMFLIDRLPRHATETLQSAPQTRHISLDNLGNETSSIDEEDGFLGSLTPTPKRARSLATTTGLVIHAAADGIAMGASSTTSDMKLGLIIFAAIMIHKAPAAFGLTSVLLKQGLSKRAARGHLIVFSLAAPVGAIRGTFLYVAMHAMQEDSGSLDHNHGVNGYAESNSSSQRKQRGPQMRDTLATMAGMLVPLLTQFGHHH
ncbi:Fc.00g076540.m01.CDS01 [Cosmosporella sp. VM-42]